MTEDVYNKLIEEFKVLITSQTEFGLKKGQLDTPLLLIQAIDDNETPKIGKIEGVEELLEMGQFEMLPTVLEYTYEKLTPVATALVARVKVTSEANVAIHDILLPVGQDALFIQIETHDKECTICWKIEKDVEIEKLTNIYNPEYEWKEKEQGTEMQLLSKLYVYIEPDL